MNLQEAIECAEDELAKETIRGVQSLKPALLLMLEAASSEHANVNGARALDCLASLGSRESFLESSFDECRGYGRWVHIDDSFPQVPSPYRLLSDMVRKTGKGKKKTIAFLIEAVVDGCGEPRWEAFRCLCEIWADDPASRSIIANGLVKLYKTLENDPAVTKRTLERGVLDALRRRRARRYTPIVAQVSGFVILFGGIVLLVVGGLQFNPICISAGKWAILVGLTALGGGTLAGIRQ